MPTGNDETLEGVWGRVVKTLEEVLPARDRAWLSQTTPVGMVGDTALVAVPNEFTRSMLETRFLTTLTRSLGDELGREIKVAVSVDETVARVPFGVAGSSEKPGERNGEPSPWAGGEGHDDPEEPDEHPHRGRPKLIAAPDARLNKSYVFESFITGSSNRFAHAAALAVAESPAKAYNPLFIYGDSGLGKTHLLHAIGHYTQHLYPTTRVRYVSTEEFTNDFINAIANNKGGGDSFRRRYRDVDVLLVDDIQFLEGKEQTQEEFFHTFNTLYGDSKQIVMTSDRPPKQLATLEDRLRNRFEWGLMTDVQAPELETRIAILRRKAESERIDVPLAVMDYIAQRVDRNIRELEGALIRVGAFANLNKTEIDLAMAEVVLRDLLPSGGPEISASLIIGTTAEFFAISVDDICGPARSRNLVRARQVAQYVCRELTELSLPKIGDVFGGRDHTTVMHACKNIGTLMSTEVTVHNQVTEIINRVKQRARQQ